MRLLDAHFRSQATLSSHTEAVLAGVSFSISKSRPNRRSTLWPSRREVSWFGARRISSYRSIPIFFSPARAKTWTYSISGRRTPSRYLRDSFVDIWWNCWRCLKGTRSLALGPTADFIPSTWTLRAPLLSSHPAALRVENRWPNKVSSTSGTMEKIYWLVGLTRGSRSLTSAQESAKLLSLRLLPHFYSALRELKL